ncbi:MAG: hypothetical protein JWQ44_2938 [Chthoniobacter sp.]|nr:hypothetical protein [Chthoniobacter sp.]
MNDLQTQDQKPKPPIVVFKQNLDRLKDSGELGMLPSNVSYEAFKNAAVVAITDNPAILQCDTESLFKAIRRLAAAGLVPDGREAALVPFKTKDANGNYVSKCQAMPMVFGLIKTARNSGDVTDVRAHIVYEKEIEDNRFTYVVGDDERLEHQPILFGDRGKPLAAYAIAKLRDGSTIREFMSAEEIDKVRRSGASQLDFVKGQRPTVSDTPKGIWADWEGEMWKKTVIRRLTKRLPVSAEDVRRVMADEDELTTIRDVTPPVPTTGLARIAAKARGQEVAPADVDGTAQPHWTASVSTGDSFPGSAAWDAGVAAQQEGKAETDCPYDNDAELAADWLAGFRSTKETAQ